MIMPIIIKVTLTIFRNMKFLLSLILILMRLSEHLSNHFGITKYVYDVHGEMGKRKNTEECMCGNNLK